MQLRDKKIWNEAVKAACKEIMKFDGFIPDKADRKYMADYIKEDLLYKKIDKSKLPA